MQKQAGDIKKYNFLPDTWEDATGIWFAMPRGHSKSQIFYKFLSLLVMESPLTSASGIEKAPQIIACTCNMGKKGCLVHLSIQSMNSFLKVIS